MPPESFLKDHVILHPGDCLDVLVRLEENSIDSCVTDPPYHLTSIVKRFGGENAVKEYKTGAYGGGFKESSGGPGAAFVRMSRGFMGKTWDGGDIAFQFETWAAVYRVLKPGAHLLAFGGTRTYHRMACAIEDAGFEIRDCIQWLYGSGFPKSHDVNKGIDRAVATAAALQWEGWGTALKPANEPIVLARKPLSEKTVAANVLKWGTGAINVDGCRVGTGEDKGVWPITQRRHDDVTYTLQPTETDSSKGRWPANVIHDGSEEVVAAFPDAPGSLGVVKGNEASNPTSNVYGAFKRQPSKEPRGDSGSAARFFYTAKADSDDRLGSRHPTVKPLDLMQYLVRLVTPPSGTVLDPFAGTGTTGEAAWREGVRALLIEREEEYQNDIRRRMALALAGPDERCRELIKAKNLPRDEGPLFERIDK